MLGGLPPDDEGGMVPDDLEELSEGLSYLHLPRKEGETEVSEGHTFDGTQILELESRGMYNPSEGHGVTLG